MMNKNDIMSKPKFMIKDLRTNLWFKVDAEFYKFAQEISEHFFY